MGDAMKYFRKKLLGHEIFRSIVSWATNFIFLEKLVKPSVPSYIRNVHSLIVTMDHFLKIVKEFEDSKKDVI